ncbi:MAG TPA: family 43 glycosylhydrolase [Terriglobales bacterium]|nr:family 43 glycosylhydrolase [Terriglobales bacterium]
MPSYSALPQTTSTLATQYTNPLRITVPSGGTVESCPDPSIIRGQSQGDDHWYLYCTNDRFSDGGGVHFITISISKDLVNWAYVGDVFKRRPDWVTSSGWLWAPDIQYFNGKYYLYYTVSDTNYGVGGSAIFVATSDSPVGPWRASSTPVVEPSFSACCGVNNWTIDSNVVEDGGQRYIFFGTFWGGISARLLSSDGLSSYSSTEVKIATSDRYEAPYIIKRNGYFYLLVSSGSCCNGPLSGYGVFAARATNILGPYVDRDGHTLLEPRVGGTTVLAMNGDRWIGPGHNAVATDAAGQDWMIYHAVDANKPYFAGSWTRRPPMLDRIDWIDGWPRVRGGAGPSDFLQAAPAFAANSQPGITVQPALIDAPGALLGSLSDEFNSDVLGAQWSWIRPPQPTRYGLENGVLRFNTEAGFLYVNRADASILGESAPSSDYMVELKFSTNVPRSGSFNFAQAGLVLYKDDSNYLKLVSVAINNTRQIEFGKQMTPKSAEYPTYGSAFLASPEDDTYLRVVKRSISGTEIYTSYSSHDGINWERGAAWTHNLGSGAKIGLVSMAGAGFSAYFDYVRVYSLAN